MSDMSTKNLLEIKDLAVGIKRGRSMESIVKGIDIAIPRGTIVGIVGESGCGKSMTAKSINGLLPPVAKITGGSILWHEEDGNITDLLSLFEKDIRKRCGTDISMIFQEPMTSLDPMMRIGDQILEVLKIHDLIGSKSEAKDKVIQMLEAVGIDEAAKRYASYPHELSGGMQQRVMIAMAMICSPKLLIADEATTALDVSTESQILELIRNLCGKYSMSAIVITHNMRVVKQLCDHVYVMYLGTIMEHADTSELFLHPLHPYTKGLMSSIPKPVNNPEFLDTIPGNVPDVKKDFPGCDFCIRCSDDIKKCFFEKAGMTESSPGHFVRCHALSGGSES